MSTSVDNYINHAHLADFLASPVARGSILGKRSCRDKNGAGSARTGRMPWEATDYEDQPLYSRRLGRDFDETVNETPGVREKIAVTEEAVNQARRWYDLAKLTEEAKGWVMEVNRVPRYRLEDELRKHRVEEFQPGGPSNRQGGGNVTRPPGVGRRGMNGLSQQELVRECFIHGVPVLTGRRSSELEGTHRGRAVPKLPEWNDVLRGGNRDIIKTKTKKFEVTLKDQHDKHFEKGGLTQGMSFEKLKEQKRLLEASVGFTQDMYPGDCMTWEGDSSLLFQQLTVAADAEMDSKIKRKLRELVNFSPGLSCTFLLYELIMRFVVTTCSDDSRSQAIACEKGFQGWSQRRDGSGAPYEVMMSFINVLTKHEDARKELLKEEYVELREYDTIMRFLDGASNELEEAVLLAERVRV